MKPLTAIMNGAGSRGREAYGAYAKSHPGLIKFVAIADPNPDRRQLFQQEHNIPDEFAFESWELLMNPKVGKIAEVAFICTPDLLHYQPAIRALDLGYDLVLEKPISPNLEECRNIEQLANKQGKKVQICHVLRFSKFWKKVKEIVDSGKIGKIIHYDHSENVSFWHYGHSYVRGIFRNTTISSPLILAKTCHDLDLMHWIIGSKPLSVQSMGHRSLYRPENAPKDAPKKCTDGCPHAKGCPWYAPRMYISAEPMLRMATHAHQRSIRVATRFALNHQKVITFLSRIFPKLKNTFNWQHWPATMLTDNLSIEGKMKAMKDGSYGNCIFHSDNDLVDHQVSTFTFPDGVIGTLTVHGMADLEGREIRIFGSKGAIRGYFRYNGEEISVTDFRYAQTEVVYSAGLVPTSHGGADIDFMDAFVKVYRNEANPNDLGTSNISEAMESHYMGFATEIARREERNVEINNLPDQK
jgi:predicted dehydrogenase